MALHAGDKPRYYEAGTGVRVHWPVYPSYSLRADRSDVSQNVLPWEPPASTQPQEACRGWTALGLSVLPLGDRQGGGRGR